MAKVPDSSLIPRSFLSKGLAGFLLYILSISSASAKRMQAKIASPRNGVSLCLLFLCAPFCFTTHAQGNAPGKALQFDGSTYVSIPDNGTLDLISNYTIEAWIKVSDTSNNTIIDKGN